MYVKYDENMEVVSFFLGCEPDDPTGYVEIPDDETIVKEYMEKHRNFQPETPIEKRVEDLEAKSNELEESIDILLSGVTSDE